MEDTTEIKRNIYKTLKTIPNVAVFQVSPNIQITLPCIIFTTYSIDPTYELAGEYAYRDIKIIIDIYAKTSKECWQLFDKCVQKMHILGYRSTNSRDLNIDEDARVNAEFETII